MFQITLEKCPKVPITFFQNVVSCYKQNFAFPNAAVLIKGVAKGKVAKFLLPETEKLLQKNGVISQCSISSKIYRKIKEKCNFSIEFSSKTLKSFLKISQQYEFFVQTSEKLTHALLNILKNKHKLCNLAIFCRKCSKILSNFPIT